MTNAGNFGEALLMGSAALSLASCALAVYLIYKVRQIHVTLYGTDLEVRKVSLGVTRNLQLMDQLSHELALDRPLPPLRGWVASPDVLLLLARRIRQTAPLTIVECGSGVSTIVQAQAAKLNGRGHVYAIDHDAEFAEQTRQALEEYGLADWATVTHAPLSKCRIDDTEWDWYELRSLPNVAPIDQLFVDGPPADLPCPLARYPAGPMLFPRLAPGASVFVDDAARPGETEVLRRWAVEFADLGQLRHYCEKGCFELRPLLSRLGVHDRNLPSNTDDLRTLSVDTSVPISS
ncbi:class I SAM-dependent methyltransferase [Thalassobaculum sp.]|uniref:class I SAM-dependent methyltransferase n=1 Tax=Thalassobaculum sp. TaxID=2022740 RepID=UPI0032EE3CF5